MKRALIVFSLILVGLFAFLLLLGRKGDYVVEKKAWKLYQKHLDIAKDPAVIPDQTFEEVIAEYETIIQEYPGSRLTPGLRIRLGEIYSLKKDYEKARGVFEEIIKIYPNDQELSAEAIFKIGETYELNGDWAKASQTYTSIITQYPETETALGVPIYIAGYYKELNDYQKTMEAYEIAIRYYRQTASDYKGKKVGFTAIRLLSNCFLEQKRWGEAVETLADVLETYATSGFLTAKDIDMNIKTINIISAYEIHDYNAAISLYQGIIERNPKLPLSIYLQKVIDAFNQLKEKGVEPEDLNKE
jgi:tetratricopeptide (TPR) repeat protein